ncbi:translation initiation factor IF-2-like [Tyto alba]|uniref:translation initiation factor IF-2-like n=1 Tax=Tyto alba TaxID=56313 RepID=UPI001C665FB9|nr:translation initiation factor IF-2-like [Tyto alba]
MLVTGPDVLIALLSPEGLGHSGSARPSKPKLGSNGSCRPGGSPRHGVHPGPERARAWPVRVGLFECQEDTSWSPGRGEAGAAHQHISPGVAEKGRGAGGAEHRCPPRAGACATLLTPLGTFSPGARKGEREEEWGGTKRCAGRAGARRGGRVCRCDGPGLGGFHTRCATGQAGGGFHTRRATGQAGGGFTLVVQWARPGGFHTRRALVQRKVGQQNLSPTGVGSRVGSCGETRGATGGGGGLGESPGAAPGTLQGAQRGSTPLGSISRGTRRRRLWQARPGRAGSAPCFVLTFGARGAGRSCSVPAQGRSWAVLPLRRGRSRREPLSGQHDARDKTAANGQNAQTGRAGGAAGGGRRRQTDRRTRARGGLAPQRFHGSIFLWLVEEVTHRQTGAQWLLPRVGEQAWRTD